MSVLERAFQIASEGECRNWEHVVTALKREGYEDIDQHFSGALIKDQINKRCAQAL
ncbi:hypothetical protein [Sphingomonas montanisoli]|nr:hypothetical protein [Sphingomonas montanisoli]